MKSKRLYALVLALIFSISAFSGITVYANESAGISAPLSTTTIIKDLTTNYKEAPLGIEQTETVVFGWKMESTIVGQTQKSYQITVIDGKKHVWDSGIVESGKSVGIIYAGEALKPETEYTWTVTVTDIAGNEFTNSSTFETGANWENVKWITTDGWANGGIGADAPIFRTEQSLTGTSVEYARLYITSLGTYEAYINGEKVRGEKNPFLAPGWTDYTIRLNYQTYDVTNYITKNSDQVALAAVVGAGWYGSRIAAGGSDMRVGNYPSAGYENVIGYISDDEEDNATHRERCLLAKLVITYADGTYQEIVTDESNWKASDTLSPYEVTGLYEGEVFNGIKAEAINGWTETGFDMSGKDDWKTAVSPGEYAGMLIANDNSLAYDYQTLPMVEAYSYNADTDILTQDDGSSFPSGEIDFSEGKAEKYTNGDSIKLNKGDTLVLDFGQNAAAVPSITFKGASGTKVYIQPAECVSDGYTSSGGQAWPPGSEPSPTILWPKGVAYPDAAKDKNFHYVLSGASEETYRAQMHFSGYRYLELTVEEGDEVEILNAESIAVSSVNNETGKIETSNSLLNQFVGNSKWSQLSNFVSVPTDCPTREQRGWGADAQVFAGSAMYHFDSVAFLANYSEILDDYYYLYDTYGNLAPGAGDFNADRTLVACWSDAGVIIPYLYYNQTGDISLAEEYWTHMSEYVDKIYNNTIFDNGSHWDWVTPSGPPGTPNDPEYKEVPNFKTAYNGVPEWGDHLAVERASENFVCLTYTLYDNMIMAEMAAALGKSSEEIAKYDERACFIRDFMIERYVDEEGNVNCKTVDFEDSGYVDNAQTALAWAIKLGVYKNQAQLENMGAILEASVKNEDGAVRSEYSPNTLAVGFPGVHVLLPMLSESGQVSTAFDLMLNMEKGTFLYAIAKPPVPATTIWEEWAVWNEDTGYKSSSHNHYAYGSASEWIYGYLLGIQKDSNNPGFKHIILQPETDDSLTYAKGSYDSYYGKIESGWTTDNGNLKTYNTSVPANTTATLYLPVEAAVLQEFENIAGVTYKSMETHNGLECAKFELLPGSYNFEVSDEKLFVNLDDAYTIIDAYITE